MRIIQISITKIWTLTKNSSAYIFEPVVLAKIAYSISPSCMTLFVTKLELLYWINTVRILTQHSHNGVKISQCRTPLNSKLISRLFLLWTGANSWAFITLILRHSNFHKRWGKATDGFVHLCWFFVQPSSPTISIPHLFLSCAIVALEWVFIVYTVTPERMQSGHGKLS